MSAATKLPPTTNPQPVTPSPSAQPSLWLVTGARGAQDARLAYGAPHAAGRPTEPSAPMVVTGGRDTFAWVRRCEGLTAAEERRLAARMQSGDRAARERLFEAGARWALTIARWHATTRAPLDDLAQIAWMTLWQALPSFDPQEGRLTTFVWRSIRRDVSRAVNEMSSLIRRPVWVVDAERREWRFYTRYEQEHGCEPSAELVAAALDTPPTLVRQVVERGAARRPLVVSLDAPQTRRRQASGSESNFEASIAESVASEDERDDPEWMAQRAERSRTVTAFAAACLTPREQQVVALYYSDDTHVMENLAAIGRRLRISREAVRQAHDRALRKLRAANSKSGGALSRLYADMDG